MGVYICPCKIKEKVSDKIDTDTFYRFIDNNYENDYAIVDDKNFIEPFSHGIYLYEEEKPYVSMSYGSNCDFIDALYDMGHNVFSTTLRASGIDNNISYITAEKMLLEFKECADIAEGYMKSHFGDEYGAFLYEQYQRYMQVLEKCVKIKGIVRYH